MKPEVVFGLENSAWPALLVNMAGAVMLANTAAKNVFGAGVTASPAQRAAIWSAEIDEPEEASVATYAVRKSPGGAWMMTKMTNE